jgi:HSP20 family protein
MSADLTRHEQAQPETVQQEQWIKPACDVYENENEWLITADLPGAERDTLRLDLANSELTIEARRANWFGDSGPYAGYRRVFSLPSGVDGTNVTAALNAGVVAIHLPKSEALRPRRIAIKAG